ncbi:uncharacterized protein [Triticum aestivum]|uniref:uncharacterized protein n=1 Tax=Triticum aestivum TaxID=4565 RepID=UPI001D01E835|nr:uncharacterized protein LOC123169136 [Triticum aestivum]
MRSVTCNPTHQIPGNQQQGRSSCTWEYMVISAFITGTFDSSPILTNSSLIKIHKLATSMQCCHYRHISHIHALPHHRLEMCQSLSGADSKSVHLTADPKFLGVSAADQHGHEHDGVRPLPVLNHQRHDCNSDPIPHVLHNERVPGNVVWDRHIVEHHARVAGLAALGVRARHRREHLRGFLRRELSVDSVAHGETPRVDQSLRSEVNVRRTGLETGVEEEDMEANAAIVPCRSERAAVDLKHMWWSKPACPPLGGDGDEAENNIFFPFFSSYYRVIFFVGRG